MKSRIFMYSGMVALIIGGVFATRANKRADFPADVFYFNSTYYQYIHLLNCGSTSDFTALFTTTQISNGARGMFCYYYLYYTETPGGALIPLYLRDSGFGEQ